MLDRGLIDELAKFHDEYNRTRSESENYTRGIFQAIGFKEFHDYLLLSDIERKSEHGEKIFANGRYVMLEDVLVKLIILILSY
jgi:tRNA dimethylallyltransferase